MTENDAAKHVLDAAFAVHNALGPGLLESVYEVVLAHEIRKRGLEVERQKPIGIRYDGLVFDEGFRADPVVANVVIAELKSVDVLAAVHGKQLLTQLRLSGLKLGLLINWRSAPKERHKARDQRLARRGDQLLISFVNLCGLCVRHSG